DAARGARAALLRSGVARADLADGGAGAARTDQRGAGEEDAGLEVDRAIRGAAGDVRAETGDLGVPEVVHDADRDAGGEERQRRAERRPVDRGGLRLVLRALWIRGRSTSREADAQLGVGHHGEVLARARPPVVEVGPGVCRHQPQLARATLRVGVAIAATRVWHALQLDDVLVPLGLHAVDGHGRERDLGRRRHLPLLVHLEREPDDALGGAGRAADRRETRRRRGDRQVECPRLDGLRLGLDRHLLDGLGDAPRNVRLRHTDSHTEYADTVLSAVDVAGRITVLAGEVLAVVGSDA